MNEEQLEARAERIAMAILGWHRDPSPKVNWSISRVWSVDQYRKLVRDALRAEGLL